MLNPWPRSLCYVLGQNSKLLSVLLSTQVYKWVPTNNKLNSEGNPEMDWHSIQRRIEIIQVVLFYGNWDKHWQDGTLA